jgi:hypothetical protein
MIFFRRIFKQLILTALIGFVIRKLLSSENPRAKQIGMQANRLVGGVFGLDETGHRVSRKRRASKSAGTALFGTALGYFFDPVQGYERRAKAKAFASEKLKRARTDRPMLTPATGVTRQPAGQF